MWFRASLLHRFGAVGLGLLIYFSLLLFYVPLRLAHQAYASDWLPTSIVRAEQAASWLLPLWAAVTAGLCLLLRRRGREWLTPAGWEAISWTLPFLPPLVYLLARGLGAISTPVALAISFSAAFLLAAAIALVGFRLNLHLAYGLFASKLVVRRSRGSIDVPTSEIVAAQIVPASSRLPRGIPALPRRVLVTRTGNLPSLWLYPSDPERLATDLTRLVSQSDRHLPPGRNGDSPDDWPEAGEP